MRYVILFSLFIFKTSNSYNRTRALDYAKKYWNKANHKCNNSYYICSPYGYFGDEHCNYPSHGGDDAKFVSQCLLAGGHDKIIFPPMYRASPCGREQIKGTGLVGVLIKKYGWREACGYHLKPPSMLKPGDVLVQHKGSCNGLDTHSSIVIEAGKEPKVASHSKNVYGISYKYLEEDYPYYEWIMYPK